MKQLTGQFALCDRLRQAITPQGELPMTMSSKETAAAAAEVIATMLDNVERLKAAITICDLQLNPGYVFVWPEYWLGVCVKGDQSRACGVDQATITHRADRRVFTNGKGEQASLMPLRRALEGALAHAVKVHADIAARIGNVA
jgi:hypothetical protein